LKGVFKRNADDANWTDFSVFFSHRLHRKHNFFTDKFPSRERPSGRKTSKPAQLSFVHYLKIPFSASSVLISDLQVAKPQNQPQLAFVHYLKIPFSALSVLISDLQVTKPQNQPQPSFVHYLKISFSASSVLISDLQVAPKHHNRTKHPHVRNARP
jgi:hypothetical protein